MKQTYRMKKAGILAYTESCGPAGLAGSIHFAVKYANQVVRKAGDGIGILYAEAEVDENNVIQPRCCKNPHICLCREGYAVVAERTLESGEEEALDGRRLVWMTEDFCRFRSLGLRPEEEVQELLQHPVEEIPETLADDMLLYWGKLYHTETIVPKRVKVQNRSAAHSSLQSSESEIWISDLKELSNIGALAVYSDGSSHEKHVRWEIDGIDADKPGTYRIFGTLEAESYPFPLTTGTGDPVLFHRDGKWYYLSTSDTTGDIGLYLRESDTIEGLFGRCCGPEEGEDGPFAENDRTYHKYLILGRDEKRGLIQTFWAPEYHEIAGETYLLFAVSNETWGPQCHMMRLKRGGNLTDPNGWEDPVRVCRKDGSYLAESHITLDMTYVETKAGAWVIWSERADMGTPMDTGSMLMIASVDPSCPWKLTVDPVILSRPLLGWENVEGTINNEGPYAIVTEDTVWLAYSGGCANGYTYAVGMMKAGTQCDLTDLSVWEKIPAPVLSYTSVAGEYGPGHNSFFINDKGSLMAAFHGEPTMTDHVRCCGIHRVQFDRTGRPRLDLSPERDLNPALCRVEVEVEIGKKEENV